MRTEPQLYAVSGRRLRAYRRRKGVQQDVLAVETGISVRALRTYEQGGRLPTVKCLLALRRALSFSVDEYLDSIREALPTEGES
jgi:transcriptional regulator with XRE-family HTH domain